MVAATGEDDAAAVVDVYVVCSVVEDTGIIDTILDNPGCVDAGAGSTDPEAAEPGK